MNVGISDKLPVTRLNRTDETELIMTRELQSDDKRDCEPQTPAVVHRDELAAFQLGYYSRDLALDAIHVALSALVSEINPNAFTAILNCVTQLDHQKCLQELADHLLESSSRADVTWSRRTNELAFFSTSVVHDALRSYCDRAFASDRPHRFWYELGEFLGDLYTTYHDLSAVGDGSVAVLRDRIDALPESARSGIHLFQLMTAGDSGVARAQDLLTTALAACAISDVDPATLGPTELVREIVRAIEIQPCVAEAAQEHGPRVSLPQLAAADRKILSVLEESGHRMTQMDLLEALVNKYGRFSEGYLKQRLAILRGSYLDNDPHSRPRGYSITRKDWRRY
jgi:hypothetical protein